MADALSGPGGPNEDDDKLRAYGATLADAVEAALGAWVERAVAAVLAACGLPATAQTTADAAEAGRDAVEAIVPRLRSLLDADVDDQGANPLAIVRAAAAYPTAVLRRVGAPPVARDDFAVRAFPDDDYGLTPATWTDIDPSLEEPGIEWGAAKAHVVLQRRRARGLG